MSENIFAVKTCAQQTQSWQRGYFFCPGCRTLHAINIDENRPKNQPTWHFNGNVDAPTISPSVLVTMGVPKDPEDPQTELFNRICHSHIEAGKIKFEGDCTAHNLANQTVPLPPLPEWFLKENWRT